MFKSTFNRGFQLTFENGITISVQWGTGNYCERRSLSSDHLGDLKTSIVESSTAEVAIWDKKGNWYDFGTDAVEGWVSADEVATWIKFASSDEAVEKISAQKKRY